MSGEDESQSPEQATDNLAVANQELTQEEKSARERSNIVHGRYDGDVHHHYTTGFSNKTVL